MTSPYKYKKRIKNAQVGRDGRIKQYTNKSGKDNNKQDASLHLIFK